MGSEAANIPTSEYFMQSKLYMRSCSVHFSDDCISQPQRKQTVQARSQEVIIDALDQHAVFLSKAEENALQTGVLMQLIAICREILRWTSFTLKELANKHL